MVVFGGGSGLIFDGFMIDEVNAIVVDLGSWETKAGYAGSDMPSVVFDSFGLDKFECLEKSFKVPRLDPKEHPLMLVDSFFTAEDRSKLIQYAFETLDVPAFYLGNQGILSAFAAGKYSALVLSSGHQGTQVIPVYDGYSLQKAVQSQSLAGKHLSEQALALLNQNNIHVVPQCQVARKQAVDADQPSSYTPKDVSHLSPAMLRHQIVKTIHDFKETVSQTLEVPYEDSIIATRSAKAYEFPDGFNSLFIAERFQVPEAMFNPAEFLTNQPGDQSLLGVQQLLQAAVRQVDPDYRALMYQNIVVTGGNTLIPGFIERLQYEMSSSSPGVRCRVHVPGANAERKYASWIGGSILASLGTFHQLWISKQEYEEVGDSVLDRR